MIEGAWLALRAAGLVVTLLAAGSCLFGIVFGRQLGDRAGRIRASGARTACMALALLVLQLLAEPVHMALEWAGIADPSVLRLVIDSPLGASFATRGAGLVCVAAGARRPGLQLAGVAATLVSFILSGHTVSHPHRPVLAAVLAVHIVIVTFWFGALAPLRRIVARETPAYALGILQTFSHVAVWLVPLIALAGALLATLLLPDLRAVLAPYGLLLAAKTVLFAILMGLATLNRQRLLPALSRGERHAALWLQRSIALEWLLISAVLAVTAVMSAEFSPD